MKWWERSDKKDFRKYLARRNPGKGIAATKMDELNEAKKSKEMKEMTSRGDSKPDPDPEKSLNGFAQTAEKGKLAASVRLENLMGHGRFQDFQIWVFAALVSSLIY